jgi:hypothetical protein
VLGRGLRRTQESRDLCRWHYEDWLASREVPEVEKRKYVAASFRLPDREVDRAYLGGLLDGEGSITRFDPKYGNWAIKVYMTDKEVIDWLHANVGGSRSTYLPKNRKKISHLWHLSRQADVRTFLIAISPYLKVHNKQQKAREALMEIEAKAEARRAKAKARLAKGTSNS